MIYYMELNGSDDKVKFFKDSIYTNGVFDFNKVIDKKSCITAEHEKEFQQHILSDIYNDAYNHVYFDREKAESQIAWGTDSNVLDSVDVGNRIYFVYDGKYPATDVFDTLKNKAKESDIELSFESFSLKDKYYIYSVDTEIKEMRKFAREKKLESYTVSVNVEPGMAKVISKSITEEDGRYKYDVAAGYEIDLGHKKTIFLDKPNPQLWSKDFEFGGYEVVPVVKNEEVSLEDANRDRSFNEKYHGIHIYARPDVTVRYVENRGMYTEKTSMISVKDAIKLINQRKKERQYYRQIKNVPENSIYNQYSDKQKGLLKAAEMYLLYNKDIESVYALDRSITGDRKLANSVLNSFLEDAKSLGFGIRKELPDLRNENQQENQRQGIKR